MYKHLLHYTDSGSGPVSLVFLHYFGGSSCTWLRVVKDLYKYHRCIAIDLPGFGLSQGITAPLTFSLCAGQVIDVIKKLELTSYILIGHSMGGKIAQYLARLQPAGLMAVVLVASSPPTPEPMTDKKRKQLLGAFANPLKLKKIAEDITATPLSEAGIENIIADNLKVSPTAWVWWVEKGSRDKIPLPKTPMQKPVLIVTGAKDAEFTLDLFKKVMPAYFSNIEFAQVNNAAHLIPIDAPSVLAQIINKFIITLE